RRRRRAAGDLGVSAPTTTRARRIALALAASALLATGATACEPSEPAAFTVDPVATGADATPGDGVCEDGDGRCSLRAAVEEANALATPTEITIPGNSNLDVDLTVTGSITLLTDGPTWAISKVSWTIAEGAQLAVTDLALGPVVVDGTFLARRVGLGEDFPNPTTGVDALVQVGPTGTALVSNASAITWGAPLVINEGVLSIHGTTVTADADPGPATITTATGGQTRLSATAFLGGAAAVDVCAGVAPTSYGYNLASDTTCGLAMTGDHQDFAETSLEPFPPPDARVDAIPVGTLHCGAGWDDDVTSGDTAVRPFDGDLDETAACDIGAVELRP
ncbi:MAG TPA: hypothetical protein VF228_10755, partial [Iamia sp.]